MRTVVMMAGILVGGGTVMAQMADRMSAATPMLKPVVNIASIQDQPATTGTRSVSIPRDARGHFQTDARIDGQRIAFMVDTGASTIAMNESSAARIGVRPSRGDYTIRVSTANGTVKAARMQLPMVELGGMIVRDVDAMVLPDEALSENLLGLSFLSKLKRFEYANGKMVLEQ